MIKCWKKYILVKYLKAELEDTTKDLLKLSRLSSNYHDDSKVSDIIVFKMLALKSAIRRIKYLELKYKYNLK